MPGRLLLPAPACGAMVLLGFFLGTHIEQPVLFVTALVLDVWVIAAGIAELRIALRYELVRRYRCVSR